MGKVESAKTAAAALPKGRGFGSSRCIMNWIKVFLETERLPVSAEQGKHRKTASLLRDEDVLIRIREWLLRTLKVHQTPDKLCHWINGYLNVLSQGGIISMGCGRKDFSLMDMNELV